MLERFPENLKAARLDKQIGQEDLATKTKLTKGFISLLENGARTPSLATVQILADALGVQAEVLLFGTTRERLFAGGK